MFFATRMWLRKDPIILKIPIGISLLESNRPQIVWGKNTLELVFNLNRVHIYLGRLKRGF